MLGNKLLNIQLAKYHLWNNKSERFPNTVLSTETFNQSVCTEYSEAVNARYTFQPLWVSGSCYKHVPLYKIFSERHFILRKKNDKVIERNNFPYNKTCQELVAH